MVSILIRLTLTQFKVDQVDKTEIIDFGLTVATSAVEGFKQYFENF